MMKMDNTSFARFIADGINANHVYNVVRFVQQYRGSAVDSDHKDWLIDNMMRELLGEDKYDLFVQHYERPMTQAGVYVENVEDYDENDPTGEGSLTRQDWEKGKQP